MKKSTIIPIFALIVLFQYTSLVFGEPIPDYVNVIVPPYQIIPTDEFGNTIQPKFVNQTIYFHFNVTNSNSYPLDLDIQQLVLSNDDNELVVNKTEHAHLEPQYWVTVVWKFTPQKVGNYLANVVVEDLPNKGLAYPFVITDPQRKYESETISIVEGSKNNCTDECFSPSYLSVKPQTIVTWINNVFSLHIVSTGMVDKDPIRGTVGVHYDDRFQSPMLGKNETFSFIFLKPGRYDYFSWYNPDMKGTINVEGSVDSLTSHLNVKQGSVELSHFGDNIIETIDYYVSVEPNTKGLLIVDIFKNDQFLRTDTLTEDNIVKLTSGDKYYYYKLTISGKKDQDVYQIEFKYNGQSIEKTLPITSTSMGIVNTEIQSPLQQFRSGTPSQYVNCTDGLELLIKASNGHPICVKPSTKAKLLYIKWAEPARILG